MKNAVWNNDELSTITHRDMMLPSQPYFTKMYKGDDHLRDLEKLLYSMYPEKKWNIETKPGMTYDVMSSHTNTLRFIQMLIRIGGYKKILELGSYIGVSAMYMADAGAKVITVEKGEEFSEIARRNIEANGFRERIECYWYDALDWLKTCSSKYDLIFIDCAKESYDELLKLARKRLNPNGLILVDDVFFQGDTLNDITTTEKGAGVRRMLDYVQTLEGWEKVIVPVGNGLLIMRKA